MQLISVVALCFLSVTSVVSALPVNPGDVHQAYHTDFKSAKAASVITPFPGTAAKQYVYYREQVRRSPIP